MKNFLLHIFHLISTQDVSALLQRRGVMIFLRVKMSTKMHLPQLERAILEEGNINKLFHSRRMLKDQVLFYWALIFTDV